MTDTNPQRGPGVIASGGAFVVALLACLILQFAAVAKVLGPNPKLLALQPGQHPWFPNGLLLDYVVAHEMAHLVEMNHSPRFWKVVERLCPDYRAARDELRRLAATCPQI